MLIERSHVLAEIIPKDFRPPIASAPTNAFYTRGRSTKEYVDASHNIFSTSFLCFVEMDYPRPIAQFFYRQCSFLLGFGVIGVVLLFLPPLMISSIPELAISLLLGLGSINIVRYITSMLSTTF